MQSPPEVYVSTPNGTPPPPPPGSLHVYSVRTWKNMHSSYEEYQKEPHYPTYKDTDNNIYTTT